MRAVQQIEYLLARRTGGLEMTERKNGRMAGLARRTGGLENR